MGNRILQLLICDQTTLEDAIYVSAVNVEGALIQGGAVPNKDYKIIDLYKLAIPIAVEMMRNNTVTSWRNPNE